MAYVAVRTSAGDNRIGSAFHVGEGVFVTARHVVDNREIVEVKPTQPIRRPIKEVIPEYRDDAIEKLREIGKQDPTWPIFPKPLTISRGPFYHPDPAIDVAVFATEGLHPATPHVALGTHLDDFVHRTVFVMSDAVIFGYPPIPLTTEPYLVAARAEINAVTQHSHARNIHFILSAMARGGFSGGLALSEYGFVLGLVTESLTSDHAATELGFMAVLSVEPIYECLALHKLLPKSQAEGWDDFWNRYDWDFLAEEGAHTGVSELRANITLFDDGRKVYVELYCREPKAMDRGLRAVEEVGPPDQLHLERSDEMHARLLFSSYDADTRSLACNAATAACDAMIEFGYKKGPLHGITKKRLAVGTENST